jgi:hypothetical protein
MQTASQFLSAIVILSAIAGPAIAAEPKGIAICLGLNSIDPNHYGGWKGKLIACENDARDMAKIAKDRQYSVSELLTSRATRQAVSAALASAADKLVSGDILMVSYSGHGGQVNDMNGDETDGKDETWCLYDGQLIDDELWGAWARFKPGVRILVLSDSCHSGSVTKALALEAFGAALGKRFGNREILEKKFDAWWNGEPSQQTMMDVGFRMLPTPIAKKVYERNKSYYDRIGRNAPREGTRVGATVLLLSGCLDDQLSSDGNKNGLFTATLLSVWDDGHFIGDYPGFHQAIVEEMPDDQSPNYSVVGSPNRDFELQKPFTR